MEKQIKYFACPKCGNKYKVHFSGARYRCQSCGFFFTVPDETGALRQKENKNSMNNNIVLILVFILLLVNSVQFYLTFRLYRQIRPLMKTAGEASKYLKEISGKFRE